MTEPPQRPSASHERTTLVRAPAFNPAGKAWRPLKLDLEKVSRSEVLLAERVTWMMPGVSASGEVPPSSLERLRQLFEEDIGLHVDYLHVIHPRELGRYLSDPAVLGVLAPTAHKPRGFVEVEVSLAHAVVDLLLGGAGETVALRALTEIEEGVLSFVLVEALKALAPHIEPGLPRLRLEGMARSVDVATQGLAEEKQVVVMQLKAEFGSHAGYVRLFLPESVVALANDLPPGPAKQAQASARAVRHLGRVRGMSTTLRVVIGRLELSHADLASLKVKDVVLVDELSFRPDRGEGGPARLRVGRGEAGYLEAAVRVQDGRCGVEIQGFVLGGSPRAPGAAAAPNANGSPEGENVEDQQKAEGAGLLADIPLQIAVELGRVRITAEDVVALRVGQVIDLNRLANEPVELSVNDKVIARGELVEVEGHVGVRILSLSE